MSPGVYVFYGRSNNVLYVGKSKSLRHRVSSYFQSRADLIPKVRIFAPQISKIRITETKTEFEALLVEARCIRELGPKYNSRLTDDRSPLYVVITDELFPRVLTARKTELENFKAKSLYGPFLSGEIVRRVLKIARRLFPYCNQKRTVLARTVLSRRRSCFYRHLELCPGVCSGEISSRDYLKVIKKLEQFLGGDFPGLKVKLEKEMRGAAKKKDYETAAQARDKAAALASLSLAGEYEEESSVTGEDRVEALIKLLTRLGIGKTSPGSFRIEGFDVSNLGGRMATAAMVVFTDGVKDQKEYRYFRIREKWTPDDPRMMAEAVRRRLLHPEWGKPDLVVIDGGRPQLLYLKRSLLGVRQGDSLIYLGLAKSPDRLIIPYKTGFKTVEVSPRDLGFQLLQQVRDEAHRFSRRLHLKLRKRAIVG